MKTSNGPKCGDDHSPPPGWRVARLGEVASITAGGSAPQDPRDLAGTIPFVRVQHLEPGSAAIRRWDRITQDAARHLRLFPKGTIVLPKSGASIRLEKRAILPVDACLVSHLCAIQPRPGLVDARFLLFALMAVRLSSDKAEGYPTLRLSEIARTPVVLPPIREQRKIAAVLDTIRQAIDATSKIIAATEELKRSLLRHLFTYGPVPYNRTDSVAVRSSAVGAIPEAWGVLRLDAIGRLVTGTTPRTSVPEHYGGPFMFITPGDITRSRYVTQTAKTLSELGFRRSKPLPPNSILVVCIGATIGKVAMAPAQPAATNQQINAVIPSSGYVPAFIYYALSYRVHDLPGLAGRAAIPIVNKSTFGAFLLPTPPRPEQERIASILCSVDDRLLAEEHRKSALESLFNTMLHLLMTGQVRVNDWEVPDVPTGG